MLMRISWVNKIIIIHCKGYRCHKIRCYGHTQILLTFRECMVTYLSWYLLPARRLIVAFSVSLSVIPLKIFVPPPPSIESLAKLSTQTNEH